MSLVNIFWWCVGIYNCIDDALAVPTTAMSYYLCNFDGLRVQSVLLWIMCLVLCCCKDHHQGGVQEGEEVGWKKYQISIVSHTYLNLLLLDQDFAIIKKEPIGEPSDDAGK